MPGSVRKIITGRWDSPFTVRLKHFVDLTPDDVETLRGLIEYETAVEKRRDLVVDGYPYTKLCFVKDGMAARYKVLRNGKRQIVEPAGAGRHRRPAGKLPRPRAPSR